MKFGSKSNPEKNAVIIGLDIDRDMRRKRIDDRLQRRLESGMTAEVESLLAEGISAESLIYYGLEYKWLTLFCDGENKPGRDGRWTACCHTSVRQRQMTWFRGMGASRTQDTLVALGYVRG